MKEQSALDQFDLRSRLRFNSDTGRIWLDEHRMVLMHTRAVGALRKELFDQVGEQKAQAMLWRAAFEGGKLDAEMALKMIDDAENYDVFQIGRPFTVWRAWFSLKSFRMTLTGRRVFSAAGFIFAILGRLNPIRNCSVRIISALAGR